MLSWHFVFFFTAALQGRPESSVCQRQLCGKSLCPLCIIPGQSQVESSTKEFSHVEYFPSFHPIISTHSVHRQPKWERAGANEGGCMWLIGGEHCEDPEPRNGPGKQTFSYPTENVSLQKTKAVPLLTDLGRASISLGKLSRQTHSSGPVRYVSSTTEKMIFQVQEKRQKIWPRL